MPQSYFFPRQTGEKRGKTFESENISHSDPVQWSCSRQGCFRCKWMCNGIGVCHLWKMKQITQLLAMTLMFIYDDCDEDDAIGNLLIWNDLFAGLRNGNAFLTPQRNCRFDSFLKIIKLFFLLVNFQWFERIYTL